MEKAIADQDYSKREAAEIAGCDERTIHRAIKAHKLAARKEPLPGGGEKTLINGADLNAWTATREVTHHSTALTRQPDTPPPVNVTPEIFASVVAELARNQNQIVAMMEQMNAKQLPAPPDKQKRQRLPLTDRLTVTLDEAAQLSGVSKAEIKTAVESGKLKAIKRPHGKFYSYRVMSDDLRDWLKTLRA